ncbi:hypothetical protein EOM39_06930 [Candidatus Gracilibacteria bacterium]|nr:hypothetical protein [Candidatus Gracilibacteria bacterium]
MELELRNRFIEKYDELVIGSLDSDPKLNIEEIQILVLDILDGRKNISGDKKIIKFISESLNNNLPINWITGDLLTEAYSIMIPGVKTYKQSFVIPDFDLNVMNGAFFSYGDKMLVFNEGKMILCDISSCDKAYIKKYNDLAIKKCLPQINVNYNTGKRFLQHVVIECSNYINKKK